MLKIAIIGSNGQLGTDVFEVLSRQYHTIPLNHQDIEIVDLSHCMQTLFAVKPDIVINTASFHNVPLCEEKKEEALRVNVLGPQNLAKTCQNLNAKLIHVSTDYVFDGKKKSPYTEEDTPNPLNFYAITKLAGEHAVLAYCEKSQIIRVSGIYGKVPSRAKGSNFVSSILSLAQEKKELRIVDDEILTPTNTEDIADQLPLLLERPETGIFHISNSGSCSWYAFACAIFEILGHSIPILPISSSEYSSPVKRPSYSVLENARLKKLGIYRMRPWREALEDHLKKTSLRR
jgi:dTDP-4-dehydrorhamnose reductase